MKKYMKDHFEFYGIKAPERSVLSKKFFKENDIPGQDSIRDIIKELWDLPQREYQYFGMDLLDKFIKNIVTGFRRHF